MATFTNTLAAFGLVVTTFSASALADTYQHIDQLALRINWHPPNGSSARVVIIGTLPSTGILFLAPASWLSWQPIFTNSHTTTVALHIWSLIWISWIPNSIT